MKLSKYLLLILMMQFPFASFGQEQSNTPNKDGQRAGYLLLNAHSIVIFAPTGKVAKQFHFRAPRDRENVFVRLVAGLSAKTQTYFLDTKSGEIYETSKL
jgi:hypothetical protein